MRPTTTRSSDPEHQLRPPYSLSIASVWWLQILHEFSEFAEQAAKQALAKHPNISWMRELLPPEMRSDCDESSLLASNDTAKRDVQMFNSR